MITKQFLCSPSSLLPLLPTASWHLHPCPEGSRSCDSAPSPPPKQQTLDSCISDFSFYCKLCTRYWAGEGRRVNPGCYAQSPLSSWVINTFQRCWLHNWRTIIPTPNPPTPRILLLWCVEYEVSSHTDKMSKPAWGFHRTSHNVWRTQDSMDPCLLML